MIKAIFYKEWIKMRWFCLVAALFLAGFTAYALLRVQRVITFKGAAHIWEVMLEKEVVFIDILQYLPVLLGVLLALVQFIPEMTHKRLKLTLHLPFPQRKMILLMMGVGLAALAVLSAVQAFVLWCYFHTLLAPELVSRILLTSLPWYLAGLALYPLAAWVCLEPTAASRRHPGRRGRMPPLLPVGNPAGLRRHVAMAARAAAVRIVLPAALGLPFQAGVSGLKRK